MNQLIDDLERTVAELELGYFVRIVKRADRLKVIQSKNRLVWSTGNRQAIPNELRIFAMPNALDEIGLVARAPAISVHTIIRRNQYRWCVEFFGVPSVSAWSTAGLVEPMTRQGRFLAR